MDVVLVRLSYSVGIYSVYNKAPKDRETRPPLGLMYLASALENAGYKVKIIDAEPDLLSIEDVLKEVVGLRPKFLGLTATTPEFSEAYKLSFLVKTCLPEVTVIMGGAHVSGIGDGNVQMLEEGVIDFVVIGEGELAVVDIVNGDLTESECISKIVERPLIADLNRNVFPSRHLMDYSKYMYPVPGKGLLRMDAIESARGCPFLCEFCFNRKTKYRSRDPDNVMAEILISVLNYGAQFIMFFDDTFTVDRKRAKEICERIIETDCLKDVCFYVNVRANTYDEELTILMKKSGMTELSMGVETGNQFMLDDIQKGTRREQYKYAYTSMKSMGIQTRGSFIIGLPGETKETVRNSIEFAKELDLERISVNILTPYPGTLLYERAKKGEGIHFVDEDWNHFKRWGTSCIRTDHLSKEELEESQREFLTEFYSQPKIIWYHIVQLIKGNWSWYFYRPVLFAIRNKLKNKLRRKQCT